MPGQSQNEVVIVVVLVDAAAVRLSAELARTSAAADLNSSLRRTADSA